MKVIVLFLLILFRRLNKKLYELSSSWNPLVPLWPLDQISIICFKQCPYLRSFMLDICTEVLWTPYQHNRPKLPPFLSIRRVTAVYLRTSNQLPWNLYVWKYVRHCFEIEFLHTQLTISLLKVIIKKALWLVLVGHLSI